MWLLYVALSWFFLLTAYFFVLPLSKKRPVLIKYKGLIAYVSVVVIALFWITELRPLIILCAVVILFLAVSKPWFVYGITQAMITDALAKAASLTRSTLERTDKNYCINGSLQVSIRYSLGKINIISFKEAGESKKARITMEVLRKFIHNYFI